MQISAAVGFPAVLSDGRWAFLLIGCLRLFCASCFVVFYVALYMMWFEFPECCSALSNIPKREDGCMDVYCR